jgi:hypothetical protein
MTTYRGSNGTRITGVCAAGTASAAIWGSGVYTDDSPVCAAGAHAGRITLASGGTLTVEIRPGQSSYAGGTSNGITSSSFGSWFGSYVFVP